VFFGKITETSLTSIYT